MTTNGPSAAAPDTGLHSAFRLALRFAVMAGLSVAILVALLLVRGVVLDRQQHRSDAVAAIAASHAGRQQLAGPVLVVPYEATERVRTTGADGREEVTEHKRSGRWTFFPETLSVRGRVVPGTRHLGLHEVRVYEFASQVAAAFDAQVPEAEAGTTLEVGRPWLAYSIADVRGISSVPRLLVDGAGVALAQGMGATTGGGIHARLPAPRPGDVLSLDTRLDLVLAGTESLAIAPLGARNDIAIDSAWPHPRFQGAFLPRTREVGPEGFHAEWQVSSLASNAQGQFLAAAPGEGGTRGAAGVESVAVALVDPVNPYTLADRASKYGILFVLLTFGGFFLFETVRRLPIHPVQYLLVGLALSIFFLLLLALSERIAFGWAYLAASAACTGLLGFYLAHVLRSRVRGLAAGAAFALLYAALYGLLVSEDNALVLGAGLLFAVLAGAMVATRKVDWYAVAHDRA
ncbi:MAG TPA: cell envelope integrity protein CreD [Xanthomonadaceae bacterium]|nr:cell envelope integrity protein CreD [Xanthomonadaceae bacterium]